MVWASFAVAWIVVEIHRPTHMHATTIQSALARIFKMPILAVLSAALLTGGGASRATELSADEQQLAAHLTGDRGQRRNSPRMRLDPILTAVARARAEDMAVRRYFAHVNPDGLGPNALVRAAGYALPSSWGGGRSQNTIESIGAGYATAEQAWEGWMNSPSHRTHLLASSSFYRDQVNFGIGSYSDPSSPFRRYWVIITAPPSSRGEAAFVSRSRAKPARIAVAMPMSNADDEGAALRPSAARARTTEKLWNSDIPVAVPRARVAQLFGAR